MEELDYDEREREGEKIATHLEAKGLHDLLEATLDPMTTDEFGSGACLYHAFVSVIAHEIDGLLWFHVLHPADDRDRCPIGKPDGFAVAWNFEPKETARQVRRLAAAANRIYKAMGLVADLPAEVEIPAYFWPEPA